MSSDKSRAKTRCAETEGAWRRGVLAQAPGRVLLFSGLRALLVLTGMLGLLGCGPGDQEVIRSTRGYVVISIDTLRADHLTCYGYERPTSPFIDSLADRGALFENAFVQLPGTLPSHMSIFTGLFPSQHGVYPPDGVLPLDIPTIPEIFRAAGFRTAGFTEGGYVDGDYGFSRGFDDFSDEAERSESDIETTFRRGLRFSESLRPEDRFFLFLHTYSVHDPYFPDERYSHRYWDQPIPDTFEPTGPNLTAANRGELELTETGAAYFAALYDASINYADDVLRDFFQKLDDIGLRDDVTFVVTSDHGEEFLEHGGLVHEQTYPETLRVPLIFLHPDLEQSRRIQSLVQSIDIAPTLLDLARIDRPTMSGRSLVPLLEGAPEPLQSEAFSEAFVRPIRTMLKKSEEGFHQILMSTPSSTEGAKTWVSRSIAFDVAPGQAEAQVRSYHVPRDLKVMIDGQLRQTLEIMPTEWTTVTLPIPADSTLARVVLETDTCDSPLAVGESEDSRCLSFLIQGALLVSFELYDLARDPQAQLDLSRGSPLLLREMTDRLLQEAQTLETRAGERRDLDPELEEQLRALGYLQ